MEEALLALLLADAGVAALVGARIDWGARLQGDALPAIALHLISDPGDHTLAGPTGDMAARVQVDCWAGSLGQATLLGRAVRSALDGHAGGSFRGILFADRRSGRDLGTDEAEQHFRDSLDFIVHYHIN